MTASVDCVSSRCIGLIFWTFILSFVAVAADALLPLVPPPPPPSEVTWYHKSGSRMYRSDLVM